MTVTTNDVRRALRLLGKTPDAIAASLANKGIRGVPEDADRCVFAVYLQQQFPELRFITVDSSIIAYGDEHHFFYSPSAVARFIDSFDEGAYPELIDAGDV